MLDHPAVQVFTIEERRESFFFEDGPGAAAAGTARMNKPPNGRLMFFLTFPYLLTHFLPCSLTTRNPHPVSITGPDRYSECRQGTAGKGFLNLGGL